MKQIKKMRTIYSYSFYIVYLGNILRNFTLFLCLFFQLNCNDKSSFIVADPPIIIFNSSYPGEIKEATVTLKNVGNRDAINISVSKSCSCTSVNAIPDILKPNQTYNVRIQIRIPTREGAFSERVTVSFTSSQKKENPYNVYIDIRGIVEQVAEVIPKVMIINTSSPASQFESWWIVQNKRNLNWSEILSSHFISNVSETVSDNLLNKIIVEFSILKKKPSILYGKIIIDKKDILDRLPIQQNFELSLKDESGHSIVLQLPVLINNSTVRYLHLPHIVQFNFPKPSKFNFIISSTKKIEVCQAVIKSISLPLSISNNCLYQSSFEFWNLVEIDPPQKSDLPISLVFTQLELEMSTGEKKNIPVSFVSK